MTNNKQIINGREYDTSKMKKYSGNFDEIESQPSDSPIVNINGKTYDTSKMKKFTGDIEALEEKPSIIGQGAQWASRNLVRSGVKAAETVAGMPGDIAQLIHHSFRPSDAKIQQLEDYLNKKLGKDIHVDRSQEMPRGKDLIPTSGGIHKNISQRIAPGGYLDPKGKFEEGLDEFVGTVSSLMVPSLGLFNKVGKSLGLAHNFSKAQPVGKVGRILENIYQQPINKASKVLPAGQRLASEAKEFIKLPNKTADVLNRVRLKEAIKLAGGKTGGEWLMSQVSGNEKDRAIGGILGSLMVSVADPKVWASFQSKLSAPQSKFDTLLPPPFDEKRTVETFNKVNRELFEKQLQESSGILNWSKKILGKFNKSGESSAKGWVDRLNFKPNPITSGVLGGFMAPFIGKYIGKAAGAGAAVVAAGQLQRIIGIFMKSKPLRDHYSAALKAAAKKNEKLFIREAMKLDKEVRKREQLFSEF